MKHVTTITDLLDLLPKGGTVAELGVAGGRNAARILAHTQPKQLHLIDPWDSERYADKLKRVRNRFADEVRDGIVHIHIGCSEDVLPRFPDHFFDWAWIDTTHTYPQTMTELRLCGEKVKPDGWIAGHDYVPQYGVIRAVTDFCAETGWRLAYLTRETFVGFALRRTANGTEG